MKHLVLLLLLFPAISNAYSLEVMGGGLTYHLIDNDTSYLYSNKLTNDGRLIYNSVYGVGALYENEISYQSLSYFGGNNSVALPISGLLYKTGLKISNWYCGLAMGMYIQDDDKYRESGVDPFRMTEIGSTGLIPIVGISLDYKINITNKVYMKLNNLITPILTNNTLSAGMDL